MASLKTRVTLFTLVIFVIGIWALAFYASRMLREDMQTLLGEQQFSTVSFMAAELDHELDDRLRGLEMVAGSVSPAIMGNPAAVQALLEQRPLLQRLFNAGVTALGLDGTAIADVPLSAGRIGVNYMDLDVTAAALREGKATIGRPSMGKKLRAPVFVMAVPIRDAQGKVIGALAGVTNLGKPSFLDKITDNHYGKSGGYLLVAPQHRLVVTATDKSRIMETLPAPGINPAIDRFVQGYEGTAVFVNPLGVGVLASSKRIPVAGWDMVALLPTAEAFAPIHDMQQRMLIAAIFLTLLAGGLTWWMLRRQLSPMLAAVKTLATLSDTNQPPQPLPIARQDEIGELIGGFNRLLETLGQREVALRESEGRFRGLTEMSSDFYWESDAEHRITRRTESKREPAEAVFREASFIGKRRWEIPYLSPDESGWQKHRAIVDAHLPFRDFEVVRLGVNGAEYHFTASGDPVFNAAGEFAGYRGVGADITKRKQAEEKIKELAFFDQLTGLPNRTLLLDRLKQAVAASSRNGSYGALLFIDLDNFKTLNDTLGHDIGDLLLKQVAQRLTLCVREGDSVARLGGDEFVVVLAGLSAVQGDAATAIETVAEKILATLKQPYQLGKLPHRSTASIGVTLFRGDLASIDDLMKQADLAMYKSKAAGRDVVRFFDPSLESAVKERAALEDDLRRAMAEKQLLLHYQAQMAGSQVTGAEVLVRWQHPQRGMVLPAEFIPLAEETGLILALGQWVLETACTQLAVWATRPERAHLTLAVNVSARQFHERDFVDQVLAVLAITGANSQRLKLELTESLLVSNVEETIEKMIALQAKGVGFELDDFGTGYSSLSYLKRLPLDQLKIDRSFVFDVLSDPNDAAIAKTIIALAQSLGLGVIAEGVETAAQRDFLASSGCHAYQGYFFSRPLPIEGFEAFVQRV